jgi:hypothetical protein
MHVNSRKYLRFRWPGQLFQFTCLCFGLASAPRVYTKVKKPIFAWFRSRGIRTSFFIDDSIYLNQLYNRLSTELDLVLEKLTSLGLYINEEKSVFVSTQIVTHLGFILNSIRMTITLKDKKVLKVLHTSNSVLNASVLCIRDVAQLIGLLVSSFPALFQGKMHYRFIERDKISALRVNNDFDDIISVSHLTRSDI